MRAEEPRRRQSPSGDWYYWDGKKWQLEEEAEPLSDEDMPAAMLAVLREMAHDLQIIRVLLVLWAIGSFISAVFLLVAVAAGQGTIS